MNKFLEESISLFLEHIELIIVVKEGDISTPHYILTVIEANFINAIELQIMNGF